MLTRTRILQAEGVKGLSAYVLWLGFPALLIRALGTAPPPDPAMARGLLAYGTAAVALLGVTLLAGKVLRWPGGARGGAAMAGVVGNTAFLGAPFAVSVFGAEAGGLAAGVIAVDFVVLMAFAMAAMQATSGAGKLRVALTRTFLNPVVAAAIVGAVLSFGRVGLPGPLARGLDMLAASASPAGLTALGAVIGLEAGRPAPGEVQPVVTAILVKLVLMPALVWVAVTLAGAPPAFRAVAVLLAGCPTAVNVFIQAREYSDFGRGAAQVVVTATLFSALTLPLIAGWMR
ncbi:Hypothetical protein CAP_8630 [Chondromyces apiculatus DSM 436]|uniref:Auxin Efflux Carrier n=1 Tax=Chondromyces apiculatus DSM 436 TaxID=1192034 RepID=A0A017SX08_9BACT|nr:Hypothetical protein CAP_8630 [Chondromyces apiculatus DSM 436]